jgi:hypothetical protein
MEGLLVMLPQWPTANRERPGALTDSRTTIEGDPFIENGFVARVRAVGVVYRSAFTSITACL